MRQSHLFAKTRKEVPKDEVSKNAKLLIKGGFIYKEMAGVYSFLPLGLRVLERVTTIIREEMNATGAVEVLLSALQSKETWEKTDRWDSKKVDNWFKTKLVAGGEVGLAFTHEEPLTALMCEQIRSFRDLPVSVYQIQTKFRNEQRAKSGLIRTREFLMKDLYSFSKTQEEHDSFYERMKGVYRKVFDRVGLGALTHLTYASGGSFSPYSHEFQTICDAGEDTIHLCEKCGVAVNEEIIKKQPVCPECGNKKLVAKTSVEVGNIFNLGTRFSEAFGLSFVDEKNTSRPVIMGSYGIGPGRIIGTLAEVLSGERGLIWPDEISPFSVHLIVLDGNDAGVKAQSEEVYRILQDKGVPVLLDDRDARAGEKFADADLIGIPLRIIVSARTVQSGKVETLDRRLEKTAHVPLESLISSIHARV